MADDTRHSDEEARRIVDELLRPITERHRALYEEVARMERENAALRAAADARTGLRQAARAQAASEGGPPCPVCHGSGERVCPACDGRGDFIGRRGRVVRCDTCSGKGRVRCRGYGCEGGIISR
jgi:hypothetical protein